MIRWTALSKRMIIEDVRNAAVDQAVVLAAWDITPEEYAEWTRAYDAHGYHALKTTRLQEHRDAGRRTKNPRARKVRGEQQW